MSIPVKNNNGINILNCLKEFINYVGKPEEFQSDNGPEYKNNLIKNILDSNNIIHIFSSPRHPKSNGVVEVVHKEVRKNILTKINEIIDDVTFKNVILECVSIHNNNIHTVTGYKPSYLLKNQDDDIYKEVIDNIKNKYKYLEREDEENYVINIDDHLITKGALYKLGKALKSRKTKFKTFKLALTAIQNFNCGLIKVKVDVNLYGFNSGETYFTDPKDVKIINELEWNNIIDSNKKDDAEHKKKIEASKKRKTNKKVRKNY